MSFIWTYLFVPETRGKTLEEMDSVFRDVANEEEEARRKAIERGMIASAGQTSSGENIMVMTSAKP